MFAIPKWVVYGIVSPTLFFLEGGGAAKLCDNQLLDNSDTKPSQCHTRSSRCPRTLELKLPIPAISSRCFPRSGCAWAVGVHVLTIGWCCIFCRVYGCLLRVLVPGTLAVVYILCNIMYYYVVVMYSCHSVLCIYRFQEVVWYLNRRIVEWGEPRARNIFPPPDFAAWGVYYRPTAPFPTGGWGWTVVAAENW